MFNERIKRELNEVKERSLYRSPLVVEKQCGKYIETSRGKLLNFSSNDYLGLSADQELKEKYASCVLKYGINPSSSRLMSGSHRSIEDAERAFADYFKSEEALFFPSGFQANIALMSTLFQKEDLVLFDKRVHASIHKGLALSGARLKGFRHNSYEHLKKRYETGGAVVLESHYSMDGDTPPVKELVHLRKELGFFCIADEAHALGVLGPGGRGLCSEIADIRVGTLGKAFGFNGAFLLLSNAMKEYFMNFSAPLIYTTALPPAFGSFLPMLLKRVADANEKREALKELSSYTRQRFNQCGFKLSGEHCILSFHTGSESKAMEMTEALIQKGIYMNAARYPTVPLGQALLRISLTAHHSKKDIERLISGIKEIM